VVGSDDFHDTVTMVTTRSQLNTNTEREASLPKTHRGHTNAHIHTHTHTHTPMVKYSMQNKNKHLKATCISHLGPIYFTTLEYNAE